MRPDPGLDAHAHVAGLGTDLAHVLPVSPADQHSARDVISEKILRNIDEAYCLGRIPQARAMAEEAVDLICDKLEIDQKCSTASTPLAHDGSQFHRLTSRLEKLEHQHPHAHTDQIVCECELVMRGDIESALEKSISGSVNNSNSLDVVGMHHNKLIKGRERKDENINESNRLLGGGNNGNDGLGNNHPGG